MQSRSLRDASLVTELVSAVLWIVGIGIAYRVALAIFLVEVPQLGPALIQIVGDRRGLSGGCRSHPCFDGSTQTNAGRH